jgi:serine/threonine-protein kinase
MSQNGRNGNYRGNNPCSCGNDQKAIGDLPSGEWTRINETADKFELAWKHSTRPAVEDYVAGLAEPRRSWLLRELLRVERELRLRAGEEPRADDYHARLPGDRALIDEVFAEPIRSPSLDGDEVSPMAPPPATASFIPSIQRGVLAARSETIGTSRPVMLRETWPGEGPLPMVLSTSSEMPHLHDGSDRLQLFGEIARGGMGAVLKGRDPDLGRDLAVKVLLDAHRDNPELVLRFIEEAQISGQLQHPGVVPVYELGEFADSRPYFSMKLVRGRTLSEVLRERPNPAHELSAQVGTWIQICQTMAYAHARGVIHRDLKPSNIMLGNFGEVQVMDWGLAKVLPRGGVVDDASSGKPIGRESAVCTTRSDRGEDSDRSLEGLVLGTPSYMAPEQARGEIERLDERCDVFALGSILCEILTGKPAFSGLNSGEIHLKATQADLSEAMTRLNGCGADAELVALARDCLAAELEQRPRDAGVVAARGLGYTGSLERRMRQAELDRAAEAARAEEARHRVVIERQRRHYQVGLAASLLVLSVMGGLSFTYWAQQRQARMARAELAMAEAGRLRDQAIEDLYNDQKWAAAEKGIADAARAFAEAGRSEATERLTVMRDEIHAAREEARRDRALLDAVANVRSGKQDLRHAGADAEYARAFREAGLDVDSESAEEIAAKLKARPAALNAVVAALDDWALERRAGKQPVSRWRRPLEAARAADPDSFRERVRAAILQSDPRARAEQLQTLASEPAATDLSPTSALLLAAGLRSLGEGEPAEKLLRAVAARHPEDVWVNFELAAALELLRPTAREDILRYYSAARAVRPETAHALAHFLDMSGRGDEALAVFADLVERRPRHSRNLTCYGTALLDRRLPEAAAAILARAVEEGRDEVRQKPDEGQAHQNLAYALRSLGNLEESVAEFHEAIRLEPDELWDQLLLGDTLTRLGAKLFGLGKSGEAKARVEEAVAVLREVIRVKPDHADAHNLLADAHNLLSIALTLLRRYDEAAIESRGAIRLRPNIAKYHVTLGHALHALNSSHEGIAEFRLAQRLDPDYADAHCELADILSQLGDYAGAAAEFRAGQVVRCRRAGIPFKTTARIVAAEHMAAAAALPHRLSAILAGTDRPKDTNERLAFAQLAYNNKNFAAAALLWDEALDAKPAFGECRTAQHRYHAACAAVLAAAGQGENGPVHDNDARSKLRKQAVAWLNLELATWEKCLDLPTADYRKKTIETLQQWLKNEDLASIRSPASLAKLPETELESLRSLWARVDSLLAKARRQAK